MLRQHGYFPSEWEYFLSPRGQPQQRPDHFTFLGETHHVDQWVQLYKTFLLELARRSPDLFHQLPDTLPFHSNAAYTKRFARTLGQLLDGHGQPLRLPDGDRGFIYCKSTMWIKDHFWNIRHLLELFGIPESEMVVYLRVDHDAE